MDLKFLAVLVVLLVPSNAMAEALLCITESTVGYNWENDRWTPKIFNNDTKYTIRAARKEDATEMPFVDKNNKSQMSHVLRKVDTGLLSPCFNNEDRVYCEILAGNFNFRKDTKRFYRTNGIGWLSMDKGGVENFIKNFHGMDSSYIEVGSCSEI